MKSRFAALIVSTTIWSSAVFSQADPNAKPPPLSAYRSPPPPSKAPDGLVTALNAKSFAALKAIKTRNPGAFTDSDAKALKQAILAEAGIDDAERDLLEEMVQSQFRSITITSANTASGHKLISYPVSGNAKQTLINTLSPPADLEAQWSNGQSGWAAIVAEHKKSSADAAGVMNFVQGKLALQWENSNMTNGYKPLRDQIAKLYAYSNSLPAGDGPLGRTIVFNAMNQLDRNSRDQIPDFLYNWVRPGGAI